MDVISPVVAYLWIYVNFVKSQDALVMPRRHGPNVAFIKF